MSKTAPQPATDHTVTVKAAPDVRVPYEDNPRAYITSGTAVTVARSAYYQRRLHEGDLIEANREEVTHGQP